jgi:NADH:ubiquinone oxidoreductase subunit 6 (subunit J)
MKIVFLLLGLVALMFSLVHVFMDDHVKATYWLVSYLLLDRAEEKL